MNRRSFLRALAAGSVAAVIGEAPRVLTAPPQFHGRGTRVFHTGGIVRAGERVVVALDRVTRLSHKAAAALGAQNRAALRMSTVFLKLGPRILESVGVRELEPRRRLNNEGGE